MLQSTRKTNWAKTHCILSTVRQYISQMLLVVLMQGGW